MKYEDLGPLASAYVESIVRTKAFLPKGNVEYAEDGEEVPDEDAEMYMAWENVDGEDFDGISLERIDAECADFLDRLGKALDPSVQLDMTYLGKALWIFRGGSGYDEVEFDGDEAVDGVIRKEAERLGRAEAGVLPGGTAYHQRR